MADKAGAGSDHDLIVKMTALLGDGRIEERQYATARKALTFVGLQCRIADLFFGVVKKDDIDVSFGKMAVVFVPGEPDAHSEKAVIITDDNTLSKAISMSDDEFVVVDGTDDTDEDTDILQLILEPKVQAYDRLVQRVIPPSTAASQRSSSSAKSAAASSTSQQAKQQSKADSHSETRRQATAAKAEELQANSEPHHHQQQQQRRRRPSPPQERKQHQHTAASTVDSGRHIIDEYTHSPPSSSLHQSDDVNDSVYIPFDDKLAKLSEMGFTDRKQMLQALLDHNGDIEAASLKLSAE